MNRAIPSHQYPRDQISAVWFKALIRQQNTRIPTHSNTYDFYNQPEVFLFGLDQSCQKFGVIGSMLGTNLRDRFQYFLTIFQRPAFISIIS